MGLQLKLNWFDKKTDVFVGEEYSKDQGDDVSVIERLGLSVEEDINNGEFDVLKYFSPILQPYFENKIMTDEFDYFIAFNYKKGSR